jgi:GT2 family glycosyltransferase
MNAKKIIELLQQTFSLSSGNETPGKTVYPTVDNFNNTDYQNGSLVSLNKDTNINLVLPEPIQYAHIIFNISFLNSNSPVQIFYKSDKEDPYTPENMFLLGKADGVNKHRFLEFPFPVRYIRLDAVDGDGNFSINYFEIKVLSENSFCYYLPLKIFGKMLLSFSAQNAKQFYSDAIDSSLKDAMLNFANINEFAPPRQSYKYIEPQFTQKIKNEINNFSEKPLISVVMPVYNVEPEYLNAAIQSIKKQWYENWEICIADDAGTKKSTRKYLQKIARREKIKVVFLKKNVNISGASNEALKLAEGDYIALMDNDDELTPDAFYEVVKAINRQGAEFIYSDEDKIEMSGEFSDPHFKPDFAPDLFLSQNYLSHLGVIKHSLIKEAGGWTIGLEGAQDYDLYLKVLERTDKIAHIPKVLYHWRKIPGSTAADFGEKSYANEAGRKALEQAMKRREICTEVTFGQSPGTYKVSYNLIKKPLVSIIIPFKDKPELIEKCVTSIQEKSTYENFEIICVSNNSSEPETFELMKKLEKDDSRIFSYEYNIPFNYSKINNYAVMNFAKGEYILFLNNDIEIITPEWIEEMLSLAQRKETAFVGAKLYFPDDTIQHAGLTVAPYTDHAVIANYVHTPRHNFGYFSRARCINNFTALTAACLMCRKKLFTELGMFDEEEQKIAYNDVDICLRAFEKGYKNVITPYCEAYHYESISRGYEHSRKQVERREKEKYFLKLKHAKLFKKGDPYFNPNFNLYSGNYDIHQKNTYNYQKFIPKDFSQKIVIHEKYFSTEKQKTLCLFSHFSLKNCIDRYVIHYLNELSHYSDIIFVSTAQGMSPEELKKVEPFCREAIIKENYGYDFGAWKTGMICSEKYLDNYSGLILCNDSVFGPIDSFKDFFKFVDDSNANICSMTDNFQINYHLQSFFIYYNKEAFNHKVFRDFFGNFKIYEDKQTLIDQNEIKFSERLQKTDLNIKAFCSAAEFDSYVNITHYYWKELILKTSYPFIKKELLRDNPMRLDISDWREILSEKGYDVTMIDEALS